MPEYAFQSKTTGESREFFYRMADAPPLDSEIRRDGDTWVRVVSPIQAAGRGFQGDGRYPCRMPQLNPKTVKEGGRDKHGCVVVRSGRERRNICAKYGYGWD